MLYSNGYPLLHCWRQLIYQCRTTVRSFHCSKGRASSVLDQGPDLLSGKRF